MDAFYTIYSLGDPDFLFWVLQGLAMMTGSDGGFSTIASVGAIGALLGCIFVAIRSVLSGGQTFDAQNILVGWIVFMAMFAPKVTVTLVPLNAHQAFPSEICRGGCVVDNVPLGPATIGAIVSKMGVAITERTEQAFGTVARNRSIFQGGFGATLQTIAALRELETGKLAVPTDSPAGAKLQAFMTTLRSYIADCYLTRVKIRGEDPSKIMTVPQLLADTNAGLTYEDQWATTVVTISASGAVLPNSEYLTCRDATDRLRSAAAGGTSSTGSPEPAGGLVNWIDLTIGKRKGFFAQDPTDPPSSGGLPDWVAALGQRSTLSEEMGDSFNDILTNSGFNAQNYMLSAVAMGQLIPALKSGVTSDTRTLLSVMITQAQEQRMVDAAGQENIFLKGLPYFTSFFEGLVYALAPFMAFVVWFGPNGLSMLLKYCLMNLWVTFWPFTLAIINLFQNIYTSKIINATLSAMNGAQDINTIASIAKIHDSATFALSTGATLAAMAPFITLGVLMGGAYTMTAMAGRMQGQEYVNEKIAAPDATQPAAAHQMMSSYTGSRIDGSHMTGSPSMWTRFTSNSAGSEAISSSSNIMTARSNTLSDSLDNVLSGGTKYSKMFDDGYTTALRNSQSQSKQDVVSWSQSDRTAESFKTKYGLTDQDVSQALLGGGLTKAIKTGLGGLINMKDGVTRTEMLDQARAVDNAFNTEVSKGGNLAQAVATERATATQTAMREGAGVELSETDRTSLTNAAQETISATEAYQTASDFREGYGSDRVVTTGQFAQLLADMDRDKANAIRASADAAIADAGLRPSYEANLDYAQRVERLSGQRAADSARLLTLSGKGDEGAAELMQSSDRTPEQIQRQVDGLTSIMGVAGMGRQMAANVSGNGGSGRNAGNADPNEIRAVSPDARTLSGGPSVQSIQETAGGFINSANKTLEGAGPISDLNQSFVDDQANAYKALKGDIVSQGNTTAAQLTGASNAGPGEGGVWGDGGIVDGLQNGLAFVANSVYEVTRDNPEAGVIHDDAQALALANSSSSALFPGDSQFARDAQLTYEAELLSHGLFTAHSQGAPSPQVSEVIDQGHAAGTRLDPEHREAIVIQARQDAARIAATGSRDGDMIGGTLGNNTILPKTLGVLGALRAVER